MTYTIIQGNLKVNKSIVEESQAIEHSLNHSKIPEKSFVVQIGLFKKIYTQLPTGGYKVEEILDYD